MYCKQCGNVIDKQTKFCPYCGIVLTEEDEEVLPPPQPVVRKSSPNTLAIIGFVIALISLLLNFFGLVGIAAVIVSVLGLIKVEKHNGNGKAMAITGLVIGAISVVYGLITIS